MKRRLPLLMLIHQRQWKNLPPAYTLSNTQSFCSSQPNSSSSSNPESDVSLRIHGDAEWVERAAFENPSSLTQKTTQPCNTAFKMHMCIMHISWSYFLLHFGHRNIAFKSFLEVSAWFGYNASRHAWRKHVRLGTFSNSRHSAALDLFCYPDQREEEPGAAFKQPRFKSLPLPKQRRRGWGRLLPGSSKSWLPLFPPHLCISLPDQP